MPTNLLDVENLILMEFCEVIYLFFESFASIVLLFKGLSVHHALFLHLSLRRH